MDDKSHVGMARCFWCGEHSCLLLETRIMGGKLMQTLPKECGVVNMVPCNSCEEHMKNGIILLGIDPEQSDMESIARHQNDWNHRWNGRKGPYIPGSNGEVYRSGHFMVVTRDWVRRVINPPELRDNILKHGWTFMDQGVCSFLIEQSKQTEENPQPPEGETPQIEES